MIRLVCCKSWSPLAQLVEHALCKHTGHGSSLAPLHKKAKCLYMKWSAARSNARGTEMLAFATYIPQPLPYLELACCLAEASFSAPRPPISPYGAAVYWWQASCQGWALALHAASHWSFPLLEDGWGEVPTPHSMLGVTAGCICPFGGLRHSWLHVSFGGLRFGGPGLLAARFVRGHAGSSPFLRAGYIRQEPLPWHLETAWKELAGARHQWFWEAKS